MLCFLAILPTDLFPQHTVRCKCIKNNLSALLCDTEREQITSVDGMMCDSDSANECSRRAFTKQCLFIVVDFDEGSVNVS